MALNQNTLALPRLAATLSSAPGGAANRTMQNQNPTGTNQGGMNAKGTPKKRRKGQAFQFGNQQYGWVNPMGNISFGMDPAKWDHWIKNNAGHAMSFGEAAKIAKSKGVKVPERKARAPYYLDEIYALNMVDPQFELKQSNATGAFKLKELARQFSDFERQLNTQAVQGRGQLAASIGGRGFEGGVVGGEGASRPLVDFNKEVIDQLEEKTRQKEADESSTKTDMRLNKSRFDATKSKEQMMAKARFKEVGKTAPKLPKPGKPYKKNGQWYVDDKLGHTTTTTAPRKKGKK